MNACRDDKPFIKYQKFWFSLFIIFGIILMGLCAVGHAALSSDLTISGEATVVAESLPFNVTYMQDLTPVECSKAGQGATAQLIDKRDGKAYWVAKVNNDCIMTQNLGLDLTTEGLDSELSDINYSDTAKYRTTINDEGETIYHWDTSSAYPPRETFRQAAVKNTGKSISTTYSYNFGDYVHKSPSSTGEVKSSAGLSAFTSKLQNVEGYEPGLNYLVDGKTYDEESMTYDAHYLVGNYYQAMTATAGSIRSTTTGFYASSSICPKGRRLPKVDLSTKRWEVRYIYSGYTGNKVVGSAPLYLYLSGYVEDSVAYYGNAAKYYTQTKYPTAGNQYAGSITANWSFGEVGERGQRAASVRCLLRMEDE